MKGLERAHEHAVKVARVVGRAVYIFEALSFGGAAGQHGCDADVMDADLMVKARDVVDLG
jgi:hypothetical protein